MTHIDIIKGNKLKVGDEEPNLRVQVLDDHHNPVNLDSTSVEIRFRRTDADSLKVDAPVTITDKSRGIIEYSWNSGDTDTAGTFLFELTVTFDSGEEETFPAPRYGKVYIEDRL